MGGSARQTDRIDIGRSKVMVVKFYAFLFLPISVCRLNLHLLRIFLPKSKCYKKWSRLRHFKHVGLEN